MNREELPRIRLRVATNVGINILCTALRNWKVVQWLPHIEEAYKQVKEDQDQKSVKKGFIRGIKIKKGGFHVANSQIVGDIFEDNDEVQCQFVLSEKKTKTKKVKTQQKIQQKVQQKQKNDQKLRQESQAVEENSQDQQNVIDTPDKKVKTESPPKNVSTQHVKHQKVQKNQKNKAKTEQETLNKPSAKPSLPQIDLSKLKAKLKSPNAK